MSPIKTYLFVFEVKSISFDNCRKDNKEFKLCLFYVKNLKVDNYANVILLIKI